MSVCRRGFVRPWRTGIHRAARKLSQKGSARERAKLEFVECAESILPGKRKKKKKKKNKKKKNRGKNEADNVEKGEP